MKRRIVFALVATLMSVAAYGNEDSVFSRESIDRAIEKTPAPKGFSGIAAPTVAKPRRLFDGPFILSQVGVWGTTWWDVDSTRRVHALGCCKEANPALRDIVKRGAWGELWWYQAKYNLGGTALTGAAKYATRRNRHWFIRHSWVLVPTALSGVHVIAAYGNEQLFQKYRH